MSTEEITRFVEALWDGKCDVGVREYDSVIWVIVSGRYETPGLTFLQLEKLSEFFGTTDINVGFEYKPGWCHTCDYGEEWNVELKIGRGAP